MKKRVNITMSDNMLKCCDIMAAKRGMNRSEYINYLVNIASEKDITVSSALADECITDMKETLY